MELLKKITWTLTLLSLIYSCKSSEENIQPVDQEITTDTVDNASDFTEMGVFTMGIEGPAMSSNGRLYIVNYSKEGTIGVVDTSSGAVSVYVTLPVGSIGNSIRFDENDNMFVADYTGHNVLKISTDKSVDTVVHEPRMNQPNDIALAKSGVIYASDPNWGNSTGNLWMIKNEKAILIDSAMGTTNGIELNLEENKLFVNESIQRNIWVYDLSEDGIPSNKTLLYNFDDFGMDGMKVHPKSGNLFIARYGAGNLTEFDKEGNVITVYKLKGDKPTNLAFSSEGKNIYVTMQSRKGVERIQL